jgi:hypothetical protein
VATETDGQGYHGLIARICAAETQAAMLDLVPALVAFEGDRYRRELAHIWARSWHVKFRGAPPRDAWPPPRT